MACIATASVADGTDHLADLSLEDADGEVLGRFELALLFAVRGPGYPTKALLTVNIRGSRGFTVPKHGDYLFRLRVKGGQLAEVPFSVVEIPPSGGAGQIGTP